MKSKGKKTAPPSPTLWEICENDFFPRRLRIRSKDTVRQYRYAINDLGKYLGRVATIQDLNDDQISRWAKHMSGGDLSAYTVRDKIGRITTLWNWLAKRRMVGEFPTIELPQPPEIMPISLSEEELQQLFDSCLKERGKIGGIPAPLWWRSHLAFVFATSERKSAALAVKLAWVDLKKKICTIPAGFRKGSRKTAIYHLRDDLIPILRRLMLADPGREQLWPWPYSEGCYYYRLGRICEEAGLPDDRKHKMHCLRVTHATMLKIAGGDPSASLMHSNPATTRDHYLDKTKLRPEGGPLLPSPWNYAASDEHKSADWL